MVILTRELLRSPVDTRLRTGMSPDPARPRIAFVYGDYPPGRGDGGSDFLRHLAEGIAGRGFDVTAIVSKRPDRSSGFTSAAGVRVEPVIEDWTLRAAFLGQLRAFRRQLEESRPDLIHLIYPDPYLRYGTDSYHLPFLIKLAARRPFVVTFFGFGVTGASLTSKAGLLSLFAAADRIVITDADLLRLFKSKLPWWARKAHAGVVGSVHDGGTLTWSSAGLAERKTAVGLDPDQRHIGFFGFWSPDKGLENLLEALGRLRRGGHDAVLVLVGGRSPGDRFPYEVGLLRLAEQLHLRDYVVETGALSPDQIARYMLATDVCALPFKVNPLGRSSLALALALGLPTVVTRPTGEDARLLSGMALLDSPTPQSLAASIALLLDDPAAQESAAGAALRAAAHWSWPAIVGDYASLYGELLDKQGH